MPTPRGEDLHEEGVGILRAPEEGSPGGCPGADVYFQARPRLALGGEHDVTGVVLEGGVLGACPGLGLSQDEEGRAARCHVQGLRQEALPEVPAPDVEPQVPHSVHVLRGALNSGIAREWGAPAPGPALRKRARPGVGVCGRAASCLLGCPQVTPDEAKHRGQGGSPRWPFAREPGEHPVS